MLITGATGGIGSATAKAVHAPGARVVLTDLRQETVEALARELAGDGTLAMTADVTDRQALDAVVTAAAERFGVWAS